MSGSARRRGQARGRGGGDADGEGTEDSSRRGRGGRGRNRGGRGARGAVTPFDGPASRGTGSVPGSQGPGSNAPSSVTGPPQGGFGSQGDPAGSRRSSVSRTPSQPPQQAQAAPPAGDPARENPVDTSAFRDMKNIDFPASFYNLDVSQSLLLHSDPFSTSSDFPTVQA